MKNNTHKCSPYYRSVETHKNLCLQVLNALKSFLEKVFTVLVVIYLNSECFDYTELGVISLEQTKLSFKHKSPRLEILYLQLYHLAQ